MKSDIISAVIACLVSMNLAAQVQNPIIVGRDGLRKTYQQGDKILTLDEVKLILKSDPVSEPEYNKSESTGMIFGMLALPACIFIGVDRFFNWVWVPISGNEGKSERGQNIENIIGISVLGLAAFGVPFIISSNAHLNKSIKNYNNAGISGKTEGIKINFGLMGNGVGVQLKF